MFIPSDQAAWPAPGEVRDLRFSLNAPVLLGSGPTPQPTRAALGWMPAGAGSVVRLWLRADGSPEGVRSYDLRESPLGPAARATALEGAERFLAGLGFLFSETRADAGDRGPSAGRRSNPRTSAPGPAIAPGAAAQATDVATAARADVRLTKFRRRGLRAEPASGATSPAGGIPR